MHMPIYNVYNLYMLWIIYYILCEYMHIPIYIIYICLNSILEIWDESGDNKDKRKKTRFSSLGLKFPQKVHVTNICSLEQWNL